MFGSQFFRSHVLNNGRKFSTSVKTGFEEFWMPFTNNRSFKLAPKIIERAEGVYYYTDSGQEILDAVSGLWCVNAGHGQRKIVEAIKSQAEKLDYAPCFNVTHELPFKFSRKLLELLPNRNFGQVFFTMCGSTSVDTALKIALAYHRSKGNGAKVRFIGRERGYHGVGFGDMAFSKGLPEWGAHLADDLERIVTLHDASTVAAVIVEPVAGSTGVVVPPKGYLKRLRDICTKHDILLIFDEVITGLGRVGASFGTEKFDVTPDMITCAKGLTNGAVPAGAVICNSKIYDTMAEAADKEGPGSTIELFHGYTYSGHPLAMAAGIATLEVYEEQDLFNRADALSPYWEEGLHSLRGLPNIIDIRNCGLMGAVELTPYHTQPTGHRAMDVFARCWDKGVFARVTGSTIAFSPPLTFEKSHVDRVINTLSEALVESARELP